MQGRGWITLTDGIQSVNIWRWTVSEHYTLKRWHTTLTTHFNDVKGYTIGYKLFSFPTQTEPWSERRESQEFDALKASLASCDDSIVRIFVKDQADLRREKYAAQQRNKANKKQKQQQKGKKGQQQQKKKQKNVAASISNMDIRVGIVREAEVHPDADSLYVEKIDVGEDTVRTIVSGIRKHIPLEQFIGSKQLVMCNLQKKPLKGIESHGMIVLASTSEQVALLDIPDDAVPGDRVTWTGEPEGITPDQPHISQNRTKKLIAKLSTDDAGQVVWNSFPATVRGTVITCTVLPNANVK